MFSDKSVGSIGRFLSGNIVETLSVKDCQRLNVSNHIVTFDI